MLQIFAFFLLIFSVFATTGLVFAIALDRARQTRLQRLVKFTKNHPLQSSERATRRLEIEDEGETDKVGNSRFARLLDTRLREAGLEMKPKSAIAVMGIIAIVMVAASQLLKLAPLPLALLISGLASYLSFTVWLGHLRSRRIKAFNEALPDCLDVFARGLRSGQPAPVALRVVANHAKGIAEEEFSFCCEEMRLGIGLNEALGGIADRIGSQEARFIVIAVGLQVETGGNLVETLENLANMLRERRKLRKKAAALSAEVRVSAAVLSSLPFAIGLIIWMVNGEYLQPLFIDARGRILALVGVAFLCMGIFSMYRLSRLDV
ncbi:type II secretion system F family protein [Sulfitobacter sp. R18_1]|uniref:type II secretion system F family protein n=1 Tax=Sulfitobacter sp. R18_1 TaxID=2821104 RepID=UPI001ADA2E43|nr:type II secretion system F family protein [Sulfitobacter sp. R18_1]MBO9432448.1 type II secretion system F family protein [Sulfitobacter sp. R18_1]